MPKDWKPEGHIEDSKSKQTLETDEYGCTTLSEILLLFWVENLTVN